MNLPLTNLWKSKALILQYSFLNIKIRYKGTYLGLVWIALEPTLFFTVLYIVFTGIRIARGEDFGIYLLTGIIIYHVFTRSTLGGLSSLREGSGILTSLKINKEFFPVTSTATAFIILLVEIGVLFGLMTIFQFIPPWTIVFLPLIIGILLLLVLGMTYLLSILFVFVRDVQPIWAVFVHALFFLMPIFWYLEDVEGILIDLHMINPLGQLIELGHKVVVFGEIPPLNDWLYTLLLSVVIFVIGYTVFQKLENKIVEEL